MIPTHEPRADRRNRDADPRPRTDRETPDESDAGRDSETLDRLYRLLRIVKVLLAIAVSVLTLGKAVGILPL